MPFQSHQSPCVKFWKLLGSILPDPPASHVNYYIYRSSKRRLIKFPLVPFHCNDPQAEALEGRSGLTTSGNAQDSMKGLSDVCTWGTRCVRMPRREHCSWGVGSQTGGVTIDDALKPITHPAPLLKWIARRPITPNASLIKSLGA